MSVVSENLQKMITWTHSPEPEGFQRLLDALSDGDLFIGMTIMKTEPVGRIAWAEYGRRRGYIDFDIAVVVAEGRLIVRFEGDARPIHHGAIFEVKA